MLCVLQFRGLFKVSFHKIVAVATELVRFWILNLIASRSNVVASTTNVIA